MSNTPDPVVIVAFALLVPAPSRASMTPPPGVRVPLVPVAGFAISPGTNLLTVSITRDWNAALAEKK